MSLYVLQCRSGTEQEILNSLKRRLSSQALEDAFVFRSERLWRVDGTWKRMVKDLFPGYVFLKSSHPDRLSGELREYRGIVRVMEDAGYLISVYKEEEEYLNQLCGASHYLGMSYGYQDRKSNTSRITEGPLIGLEKNIKRIDWHRRFAQVEIPIARKPAVIWAGLDVRLCDMANVGKTG